jgi:hypothetical protein
MNDSRTEVTPSRTWSPGQFFLYTLAIGFFGGVVWQVGLFVLGLSRHTQALLFVTLVCGLMMVLAEMSPASTPTPPQEQEKDL